MKKGKLIAPIVVTAILIAYFSGFFYLFFRADMPIFIKIIGIVIPAALAGVSIYVLVERIKEIRSKEEDDLSKY